MRLFLTIFFISLTVYIWLNIPIQADVPLHNSSHELVFKALDIGQGDALYLRLPSQDDILIDAGPDDRILSQLGQAMPLGDREIELLIISHNHLDHIGGLPAVLSRYKIDRVWLSGAINDTEIYKKVIETLQTNQVPITYVKAGDTTMTGEVSTVVLHPPDGMVGTNPEEQHDATVAVKFTYKDVCLIMTGDLNEAHEATILEMAQRLQISLSCPILKVSHHGSKTSSTMPFLQAVQPKVAVISVGEKNRYHHPTDEALQRLKDIGANIYRTDLNGTVTITTDGSNYWTKTAR
jgi:competence protein ComEC